MADVLRTRTLSETRGFMKALIDADGDRILGFTAFGVEAGEVMAVVQVAMRRRAAVYGAARLDPDPPHDGRGTQWALLGRFEELLIVVDLGEVQIAPDALLSRPFSPLEMWAESEQLSDAIYFLCFMADSGENASSPCPSRAAWDFLCRAFG